MPHSRGIVTIQRLLAWGEGPRVSAGPWGRLWGSGRQAQGSGLLVQRPGRARQEQWVGRGVGTGERPISWERDAGSHACLLRRTVPWLVGWQRAVVDMVVLPLTCSAHLEVRQPRGAQGYPGPAELDRGARFPHALSVCGVHGVRYVVATYENSPEHYRSVHTQALWVFRNKEGNILQSALIQKPHHGQRLSGQVCRPGMKSVLS